MPQSSQREPDNDDSLWESWRGEELSDGQQVRCTGNSQRNKEGWSTRVAEIARTDRHGRKHDGAQPVDPAGWSERHKLPEPVRNCANACPHSLNHAAVSGALPGAICSSAASRTRSSGMSMS